MHLLMARTWVWSLVQRHKEQGPVVQSIVSLTSSLSVYDFITKNTYIFGWKKWEKLLHCFCKSFSHFFNKKYWHIGDINVWNFNEMLTNAVVSFEQPDPEEQCRLLFPFNFVTQHRLIIVYVVLSWNVKLQILTMVQSTWFRQKRWFIK